MSCMLNVEVHLVIVYNFQDIASYTGNNLNPTKWCSAITTLCWSLYLCGHSSQTIIVIGNSCGYFLEVFTAYAVVDHYVYIEVVS